MNENTHLSNDFSREVYNFSQKFVKKLSKPQERNLRELMRGMILSGSTYLGVVGEVNGRGINKRKHTERLSRTLSKINVDKLSRIHVASLARKYKDEDVLILADGGDIQKKSAKKMEKVCKTVDGSNGHKTGLGYPLFSAVVLGLESGKLNPLFQHLYSTLDKDFKSEWLEHRKAFDCLNLMTANSTKRRIVAEDRGGDDIKRFKYFLSNKLNFVTRVGTGQKSRIVQIEEKDGIRKDISVRDLVKEMKKEAGSEREWKNKKLKKTLKSKIAFKKVYLKDRDKDKNKNIGNAPLYLISVSSEGYEDSLTILTSLETKSFKEAWKHFFYYKKRWEVENFFRSAKQNFSLEKFLVRDFKKIKALVFLNFLAISLLHSIKEKTKEFFGSLFILFKDFCHREQRTGAHPLDVLHFLRRSLANISNEYSYRKYARRKRKERLLTGTRQQSLFEIERKMVKL